MRLIQQIFLLISAVICEAVKLHSIHPSDPSSNIDVIYFESLQGAFQKLHSLVDAYSKELNYTLILDGASSHHIIDQSWSFENPLNVVIKSDDADEAIDDLAIMYFSKQDANLRILGNWEFIRINFKINDLPYESYLIVTTGRMNVKWEVSNLFIFIS